VTRLIQFLSFDGCPLADKTLNRLHDAIEQAGLAGQCRVEHIDILSPETPETLRCWGSPTILMDGKELMGLPPGDAAGCRIYPGPGGLPTRLQIANFLFTGKSDNDG
jgi:hypothetical protein